MINLLEKYRGSQSEWKDISVYFREELPFAATNANNIASGRLDMNLLHEVQHSMS